MTSEELVAALATVQDIRRIPIKEPLIAGYLLAGIEIATTRPTTERTLRKLWSERRGAGATPLLLLADDPAQPGCLAALGAVDAAGPLRSVDAGSLADVLQRLAGRSRLEAVRELSAELDRLDQAGIPGLKLRNLLTLHTLDVRLRNDTARWCRAQDVTKSIPRGADWRQVLTGLGYQLERRPRSGFLARYNGRPIAVVHPVRDASDFARLDAEGRPPEGLLLNDCEADGALFGLLAAGGRLRLFRSDPKIGSASSQYLDIDAGALQSDDLPFLGILGPDFLAEGEFDRLQQEARDFGGALSRRLDNTIRQTVLPTLGRSLGRWASSRGDDLRSDVIREELERAALTLIFRALFIAYAESAGYLPMDNRAFRRNSLSNLTEEAVESRERLGDRSTSLWDRFVLLVKALRAGNPAWGVPAYNGSLFAADGFDGAETLERVSISDPSFADILIGIGRDAQTEAGVDYSTLEIGHLGHIYEGLLSLRLSVATVPLVYDRAGDRYIPASGTEEPDLEAGDLLWQTHEGGRKGGGVYYTRTELVRQLVRGAVVPAFDAHLDDIRELAEIDPQAAATKVFDFAVLDPACGSAHFLVEVINELADRIVKFLGDTPLPEVRAALERLRVGSSPGVVIDDVALLRRLVLKRCVFGVDVSPMGAEVAKLSLWLASFVPGLSLAYLGRNVVVGNSLVGVARAEALRAGHPDRPALWDGALTEALNAGTHAATRAAEGDDRTPDEVEASEAADVEAHAAVAGLQRLFDLWTAEPFGVTGARNEVELYGPAIIRGEPNRLADATGQQRERHRFLHWPLAFPGVFSRERPGFDAVVGNPPWEEVTVERLAFFAQFEPGLRAKNEANRETAINALLLERPELETQLSDEKDRVATEKSYLYSGEYPRMAGDPDLYKYFCQRYQAVIRDGGRMGVVLPRSAFVAKGSAGFRHWLFEQTACHRIDFLLNSGRWAFDSEPRYTVALVSAERSASASSHAVTIAGTATSLDQWNEQVESAGLQLAPEAFGPDWAPPLLRDQSEADLLAKVRRDNRFPLGAGGRWRCFPLREFHETDDKKLWREVMTGIPLWKGESFDQYDPHGAEERWCPDTDETRDRAAARPRAGAESMLAPKVTSSIRQRALSRERGRARLAFRDATNRTNSRTVLACLVPPEVLLVNSAPYLAFVDGGDKERAACLAVMNSLPFDWQARRFVESHVSYFILEGLIVPNLSDEDFESLAVSAARLSCVDDRFVEFAGSMGIDAGPLSDSERQRLRVEIDARVARAWRLAGHDLDVLFSDFTLDAVPAEYREELRARLAELS
jgi:hypothetical protein